jgi:hypothetical protein
MTGSVISWHNCTWLGPTYVRKERRGRQQKCPGVRAASARNACGRPTDLHPEQATELGNHPGPPHSPPADVGQLTHVDGACHVRVPVAEKECDLGHSLRPIAHDWPRCAGSYASTEALRGGPATDDRVRPPRGEQGTLDCRSHPVPWTGRSAGLGRCFSGGAHRPCGS